MGKNILFVVVGIFTTAVAAADSFGTAPIVLTSSQMDRVTAGTSAIVTAGAAAMGTLAIAATNTGAQVTQSSKGPGLGSGAAAAGGGALAAGFGANSSTSTSVSTVADDNSGGNGTLTIGMNGHAAGGALNISTGAVVQVGITGLFLFP